MALKNNTELRAALNMVLLRLDASDKHSVEEWRAIEDALRDAHAYAKKTRVLHEKLWAPLGVVPQRKVEDDR